MKSLISKKTERNIDVQISLQMNWQLLEELLFVYKFHFFFG